MLELNTQTLCLIFRSKSPNWEISFNSLQQKPAHRHIMSQQRLRGQVYQLFNIPSTLQAIIITSPNSLTSCPAVTYILLLWQLPGQVLCLQLLPCPVHNIYISISNFMGSLLLSRFIALLCLFGGQQLRLLSILLFILVSFTEVWTERKV